MARWAEPSACLSETPGIAERRRQGPAAAAGRVVGDAGRLAVLGAGTGLDGGLVGEGDLPGQPAPRLAALQRRRPAGQAAGVGRAELAARIAPGTVGIGVIQRRPARKT